MKKKALIATCLAAGCSGISLFAIAQGFQGRQGPPPPRMHKVISKGVLRLSPATKKPSLESEVTIEIVGDQRVIKSNGIPNHKTGSFPNRGNPNRISAQDHEYRVPAKPEVADQVSPMRGEFGVAINGVPFDPGAGEFYAGEQGWQYEPLSGAIALGIDVSHAHVQPTGKYHYHGLPTGLIDSVQVEDGKHSPLIGWAADGFPMYAVYGYSDSESSDSPVQKLTSSYQLKKGKRPGGNAPAGKYDGTFVRDYEYVSGSGDLDECNGRQTVTPEFPDGTYAYFMTEEWPVVPRNYRGTPSADFQHGPGPGGQGGAGGQRGAGGPGGQMVGGPGFQNGQGERGGPPKPGEVLPSHVQQSLNLGNRQVKQLDVLQKLVDERLQMILTEAQRQQLQNVGPPGGGGQMQQQRGGGQGPPGGQGGPGSGGPPTPGEILPAFIKESLGLSDKQTQQLDELQRNVYSRLRSILTMEQQQRLLRGGPPGMQNRRGGRPQ